MNKITQRIRRVADLMKSTAVPGLLLLVERAVANPLTFYLIRVFSSLTLRY